MLAILFRPQRVKKNNISLTSIAVKSAILFIKYSGHKKFIWLIRQYVW